MKSTIKLQLTLLISALVLTLPLVFYGQLAAQFEFLAWPDWGWAWHWLLSEPMAWLAAVISALGFVLGLFSHRLPWLSRQTWLGSWGYPLPGTKYPIRVGEHLMPGRLLVGTLVVQAGLFNASTLLAFVFEQMHQLVGLSVAVGLVNIAFLWIGIPAVPPQKSESSTT